ncbi:MAG: MgtC/SapB family protein [Candidatus Aenigmarchaeota archaeon]|nr:MgtC/SapB family protein [Candidatus Aenigmarchaeota archaeon]
MEELLIKILISLALGALIGIEREKRMKESFAGFRTFMLVCLFGLISSYLSNILNSLILIISFLAVSLLCTLNFYRRVIHRIGKGITTEIAFLLTFLIGVIIYYESYPYVISLFIGFLLTLILVLKESLHEFAHKVTRREIEDFIIFGLAALVIYPILPDYPIDPFNLLKLKFIWKALVAIFGLSFLVYSIFRILEKKAILVSCALGGLINSIYMSFLLSSKIKKPVISPLLVSVSSMLLRVYILVSIINYKLLFSAIFLLLSSASGFIISYLIFKKEKEILKDVNIKLTSPISFRFTTIYIVFFSLLYLAANLINNKFGLYGFQLLASLIGLIDVNSLAVIFSSFTLEKAKPLLLILTCSNIVGNSLIILRNNRQMFYHSYKYFVLLILLNILFFLVL